MRRGLPSFPEWDRSLQRLRLPWPSRRGVIDDEPGSTSRRPELTSSALRAERHKLADAVAPVAPLLGNRRELVYLAGTLSSAPSELHRPTWRTAYARRRFGVPTARARPRRRALGYIHTTAAGPRRGGKSRPCRPRAQSRPRGTRTSPESASERRTSRAAASKRRPATLSEGAASRISGRPGDVSSL